MKNLRFAAAPLLAALLLLLFAPRGHAFNQVHGRALAMGGAHAVGALGVSNVGWNPAFMALQYQPKVSMKLPGLTPNVGFRFSNDFLSLNEVDTYFEDQLFLTPQLKADLLSEMVGEEWDFYNDGYFPLFGLSVKSKYLTWGITAETGVSWDMQLDKDFVDIVLNGHPIDSLGAERDFGDTGFRAHAVSRIGFTFARDFNSVLEEVPMVNELTAGLTVNYFIGHAYMETRNQGGSFLIDHDTMLGTGYVEVINMGVTGESMDSIALDPTNGSGIGLDFGLGSTLLDGKLTAGFSIINLVNQIDWTDAQQRIYSYDVDGTVGLEGLNNLDTWVDDNLELVDSTTTEPQNFTTELPQVVHLNLGYQPYDRLLLGFNWRAGLNTAPGGKRAMRAGVGLEWKGLKWLPLRLGASVGGRGGFSYGMGFGTHFGFLRTDIGWSWERGFLNSANGIHMAWNTVWVFGMP